MAKIPTDLYGALAPFASQQGGMVVLEQLPFETIIMCVTHTDDVIGVSFNEPNFEITKVNKELGYTVYDKHYRELYVQTEMEDETWGNTKADRQWLAGTAVGDWAYVKYQTMDGSVRVVLIIKM